MINSAVKSTNPKRVSERTFGPLEVDHWINTQKHIYHILTDLSEVLFYQTLHSYSGCVKITQK